MTPEDPVREARDLLKVVGAEFEKSARVIAEAGAWLEVAAAAKRLKKNPETIRRYIRAGQLAAVRAPGGRRGGNYLISESALAHFLTTSCNMMLQPPA